MPELSKRFLKTVSLMLASVSLCQLTGCFVVGYTSQGGPFFWPGGIGMVLLLGLLWLFLRNR